MAEFDKLHGVLDMCVAVILNAIVSMMLSERPFRKDLAFVSWMWTVFLGVMWVVGVVMYFL